MNTIEFKKLSTEQFINWIDTVLEGDGTIKGKIADFDKIEQYRKACVLFKELLDDEGGIVEIIPPRSNERHALSYGSIDMLDIYSDKIGMFKELIGMVDGFSVVGTEDGNLRITITVNDVWKA